MGMTGNYVAVDESVLQQIRSDPAGLRDIDFDGYPGLDIDKAWQAVHFLLCGVSVDGELPLGNVVPMRDENALGIEGEDFYGAFILSPRQTREVHEAIKNTGEEELRLKYNFARFVENAIYPVVEDEDANDFFDYICEHFKAIREFYESAAGNGQGIIFYIS
jgi:hypothetical protein